jgi:cytoskeletal protein RodZ
MLKISLAGLVLWIVLLLAAGCTGSHRSAADITPYTSTEAVSSQPVSTSYSGPTPRPIHPSGSSSSTSLPATNSPAPASVINTAPIKPNTATISPAPATAGTPMSTSTPAQAVLTAPKISVEEVKQKIDSKAVFMLVDVRPEVDYDRNHITGAVSIPSAELEKRYQEISREIEVIIYAACT